MAMTKTEYTLPQLPQDYYWSIVRTHAPHETDEVLEARIIYKGKGWWIFRGNEQLVARGYVGLYRSGKLASVATKPTPWYIEDTANHVHQEWLKDHGNKMILDFYTGEFEGGENIASYPGQRGSRNR